MPYYPMRCLFETCGAEFDYFTKPDLYEISKRDGFRDIRCTRCGSTGTLDRFYPRDSAPANLTVKGTWGKHASPELKGRDFYTKQERDRQLAEIGRVAVQDDEGLEPKKNHAAKIFAPDGSEIVKPKPKKARRVVIDARVAKKSKKKSKKKAAPTGPRPTEIIQQYASEQGGSFSYGDLIRDIDTDPKSLLGGIISGIKTGWLQKGEAEKTYRLTSPS
ncbi:hypothetical protein CMI37_36215 [Candidatus Pacearchaeota archaeon]|nr:hypothetical protein [Candidatus Pacearchaeota archaeon]